MLDENLHSMMNYLKDGFYSTNDYEITLKKYLIYIFSAIALIIFLIMGTNCGIQSYSYLANILFICAGILFFNILYLKFTSNIVITAYIILYLLLSLMLYLIYTGGVHQTGPLWSFILPPVVLFIHGLKKGLTELLIFLLMIMGMFFIQDGTWIEAVYTYEFKVRLVLILFVLIMLSSLYQYTSETSMKRMKKMQKDLEFFLKRDPLTGLYNRRGYDSNISTIKSYSYGAILMCDIDYFKKVNDTYGHDTGDYVLQSLAKMIRDNIRMQDISVRWGGEEFFIFLPEVSQTEAYYIAEKLRKKIENTPIIYQDKTIYTTMSIGISILEENVLLNHAIQNADKAMYTAKMNGRNQTSIS